MSQGIEIRIFPKSKKELFNEYKDSISVGTFRNWLKELTKEGKIRRNIQILNTKEVETIYNELGIPHTIKTFKL
tara:strand:+ start:359 stop:580 length:222 start_codon:yes stop_codon:yes gene_type:complete